MLGAELAGDEVGQVAGLCRGSTERVDGKTGHAPRAAGAQLCLGESGCARGRDRFRVKLLSGLTAVVLNLARAFLDGCTKCRERRLRVGLARCQRSSTLTSPRAVVSPGSYFPSSDRGGCKFWVAGCGLWFWCPSGDLGWGLRWSIPVLFYTSRPEWPRVLALLLL